MDYILAELEFFYFEFFSVEHDSICLVQWQVVKSVIEVVLYIFVDQLGVVDDFYFVRGVFDYFVIYKCVGVADSKYPWGILIYRIQHHPVMKIMSGCDSLSTGIEW